MRRSATQHKTFYSSEFSPLHVHVLSGPVTLHRAHHSSQFIGRADDKWGPAMYGLSDALMHQSQNQIVSEIRPTINTLYIVWQAGQKMGPVNVRGDVNCHCKHSLPDHSGVLDLDISEKNL